MVEFDRPTSCIMTNSEPSKTFSAVARLRSFVFAWRGVSTMLATEHNAWVHGVATLAVIALGTTLGISRVEWMVLAIAIVVVWCAEAINTAFEFLCDVASPEFHPLVEKAKDVAAGAVLIGAFGAAVVGALTFGPHLFPR
jgi:diacylglycerol kinase (ATP)